MSTNVVPQLFAIWRKSVLFTVGAISLGAERLEQQIARILKPTDRERAPRVKVPVRSTRVAAPAVTRRARGVRKAAVTRSAKTARVAQKVGARKPRARVASDHARPVAPAIAEALAQNQ